MSLAEVFKEIESRTLFISGATGLIGSTLIRTISKNAPSAKIIAFVRDEVKAKQIFQDIDCSNISFFKGDVRSPICIEAPIDYIIHAASETSSKAFIDTPVQVIEIAIAGTKNMLELACQKNVKGFVYLSSMEIYGTPHNDDKIFETHGTDLDTMNVRTSYPESKRLCESLCTAYASERNVPTKVVRLTQTFGPGVQYNDGRIFAELSRCAIEGRDIVLRTKGETKRSYLYTLDAATAILTVLTKGKPGEAYNAANEDSYCSIYEMAQLVAQEIAQNRIQVKIEESDISRFGYAQTLHMNLDTSKLNNLGWQATTDLKSMFEKTIQSMHP
ncbi:NAD-dependent epimerase/dehydratase family protein [Fibrobacter sp.]|uniref:NAD-dependent epimerase/dehydratase family protein n=1 Tax=Fibrobacter sp. TaxID=35828 RepID=UPI00386BC6A3